MTDFRPFEDDAVEIFGVAVKALSARVSQRHIGVVYRDLEGRTHFLHLAWENALTDGSCDNSYHWAEVELDVTNKMILAELAAIIAEKRADQPIPYGFEYQGSVPSPLANDGEWNDIKSMTCSTFVLGLFVTHGYPIVEITTWPQRASDLEWAKTLAHQLADIYSTLADAEHLHSLIPSYVRVRPEETAIASKGLSSEAPYTFGQVEGPSVDLVKLLVSHVHRALR